MNASDSTELLAGLLGFAAGVVFDHYLTPSISYCYVPTARAQSHRIPVESSCTRKYPVESAIPSTMSTTPKLPTDAQNIAALQSLLQAQQQQALTAAFTGVAIGVLAVSAGVAIALLPKLLKSSKQKSRANASQRPLPLQQAPSQPQLIPQQAHSPSTATYAPIQGTAPPASYPTTYSL